MTYLDILKKCRCLIELDKKELKNVTLAETATPKEVIRR